jgi:tripartite-type tricarboxylate transporter receptor subunit TctC
MRRRHLALVVGTFLAAAFAAGAAPAQSYPDKPVRIVVPYAAGGSTDSTARLLAKGLQEALGQTFIVDNRPGAGGIIGQEAVAKAAPDGYTLLLSAAGPLTVTPHSYAKLPYDPIKSFEPIKLVASSPLVLLVNPDRVKATSVQELIEEAKAHKGELTYGSFGNGSAAHLAGEMFKAAAGVDIVHVPYKGSAPALTDLLGGQIDMMFDVLVTGLPHIKAGKLRALAVTGAKRSKLLPDVPTMQEAGVKDYSAATWFGLLAPAGAGPEIVDLLSKASDKVIADKQFRQALASQGAEVEGGTPQEFGSFLRAELEKWGKAAKLAGIQPE